MPEDLIRYDILAQDALRGVVRKVLAEVARTGLPGTHHFFVKFATRAPGVRVSSRLLKDYPDEMTIVLQHQYWDLTVTEHAFEVGLSFNGAPERLLVPFTALRGFFDPSVQFGLTFETVSSDVAAPASVDEKPTLAVVAEKDAEKDNAEESEATEAEPERNAAVVSLDAFRKKS
jgi:uncharacterized protein